MNRNKTNRIDKKFIDLKSENKKAFISFITAGDPSLDKTIEIVKALEESGVDIVELGIPYSDPLADGSVIQLANQRAFKNKDLSVSNIMKTAKKIRESSEIPLLFLVYINTILIYGKERFIKDSLDAGIDGLIIPDLPLEEREELADIINKTNLALIPLVAPNSKDRIESILEEGKGFVYSVSSLGVTGRNSDFHRDVLAYLQEVKDKSKIPVAVGFGVSTKEDIKNLSPYVDGIIVGSAIVNKIGESKGDIGQIKKFIKTLVP